MRFYTAIQKVSLQPETVISAKQFAASVTATTNYSDSNQFSKRKIEEDHFISKLGEEAVKLVFIGRGPILGPDYAIYEGKKKSWDHDLYVDSVGVAVKTQKRSAALKYGLSWTFQSGAYRRDVILSKPDAWVVFVEYDDTHPHDCYVYPAFQIRELEFGEPKLDHLKGHKKVVYKDRLPTLRD